MKISIVIPAYNEEKRIGRTLKEYSYYFEKLRKKKILDYEIIIVINNTKDRTEDVVKKYNRRNSRIAYLNLPKGGKGYAIIEGFKDALMRKNDLIGFVDADMATKPDAFYAIIKNIKNQDGIIASRYLPGAKLSPKQALKRIFVSRACNIVVRALFFMPYKDTQCGAKIFKREVVEKITPSLGLTQWGIDIDLLYQARKNNFRIMEFPTVWSDQTGSKINLEKASVQVFSAIIQLRIINSPMKRFWKIISPFAGFFWRLLNK